MSWLAEGLAGVHEALQVDPGLQALTRAARERIDVADTRALDGCCDLDGALATAQPEAPRWDYAIGYEGSVWWVEVHPATSGAHIDEVVAKAGWLGALLRGSPLRARTRGLYWVASGEVTAQPAFARRLRRLAEAGVGRPSGRLRIG